MLFLFVIFRCICPRWRQTALRTKPLVFQAQNEIFALPHRLFISALIVIPKTLSFKVGTLQGKCQINDLLIKMLNFLFKLFQFIACLLDVRFVLLCFCAECKNFANSRRNFLPWNHASAPFQGRENCVRLLGDRLDLR